MALGLSVSHLRLTGGPSVSLAGSPVTAAMPPSKHDPKRPKKAKGAAGRDEASEGDAPPLEKPEKNHQIALNLLHRRSIATDHPKLTFRKWPSWHCNHCGLEFTPGLKYSGEVYDSVITKSIVEHFRDRHCEGGDSAYAQAAPIAYNLAFGEGEVADPQRLRSVFSKNAKGIWNKVRPSLSLTHTSPSDSLAASRSCQRLACSRVWPLWASSA